ncbi:MAG: UDP-N-acetylglucosamine--N-acetylmuramyl-(pentapeptide) pyrophosphoryl-undecaprenol N-acetylglucosamine transferase [Victivallales bacterium]|nr:UDP-N-acetylglucosamine--N-acetylmuramyl-(pentapeptide) pyrophosphoryl-undecaprenol N-acetylglucosamine transferase [Victivallales bacterium]
MSKHLIIACGGTGGHFYPTVSIAQAFIELGGKVTLLIAGKHAQEQLKLAKDAGIPAQEVGYISRPGNIAGWLALPFKYLKVKNATKKIISQLKPDVALGMGSYASVATCKALPSNIPLILHEGNAFMGKANRLFAGRAKAIGLSLPLADEGQLKGTPAHLVGMPLREDLLKASQRSKPAEGFFKNLGLSEGIFTVLVFGGSQGAQRINQLLCEVSSQLKGLPLQFIHLTGTDENTEIQAAYQNAGLQASVRKADYHIEECYLAADLVICRGGASSLCELALFGKPAIIIPLPTAADNHQAVNAQLAQELGGAIHFPQKDATPELLAEHIKKAIDQPELFREMGNKLKAALAKTDSAREMAKLIMENAN